MDTTRSRLLRALAGFALLLIVLAAGFTITLQSLRTWGATPQERDWVLYGDEILTLPSVNWVNAVTIDAPVEAVWPWLIQMGDTRAGFYSYEFIEKGLMQAMNDPAVKPANYYNNASRVHPEWQNPPIGQGMILDYLVVADYLPGRYLMAAQSEKMGGLGWTWLWHILPTDDGRTRLIVHMRIKPPEDPAAGENPLMSAVIELSGFVMEKKMIEGIKLRAEGGQEPVWLQPAEIGLWLMTLLGGLAAGWLYLTRPGWLLPLLAALGAVIVLFVLTYIQPALWLRALLLALILVGVALSARNPNPAVD